MPWRLPCGSLSRNSTPAGAVSSDECRGLAQSERQPAQPAGDERDAKAQRSKARGGGYHAQACSDQSAESGNHGQLPKPAATKVPMPKPIVAAASPASVGAPKPAAEPGPNAAAGTAHGSASKPGVAG